MWWRIRHPWHLRRSSPPPSNIVVQYCWRIVSSSSYSAIAASSSSTLRYDRDTGIIFHYDDAASAPASLGSGPSSSSPNTTATTTTFAAPPAPQTPTRRPLYQTIIGIEIHAQLSVPTKLFSSAPTRHHHRQENNNDNNNNNINEDGVVVDSTPPSSNKHVHAIDIAYPGTLPQPISIPTINASLLSAMVLHCNKINTISRFERKHYFYADLPLGYQITQQRWPIAQDGYVEFIPHVATTTTTTTRLNAKAEQLEDEKDVNGGSATHRLRRRGVMRSSSTNKSSSSSGRESQDDNPKRRHSDDTDNVVQNQPRQTRSESTESQSSLASSSTQSRLPHLPVQLRIERIQIEQDTGRTIVGSSQHSHVDHNRTGCALIEIVSHPDLRSAHEAAGAVSRIRKLLQMAQVCDGKMEEGSLRCDLNVSIAHIVDDTNPIKDDDDDDRGGGSDDNGLVQGGEGGEGGGGRHRLELPPNTGHRVEVKNLNSIRQIIVATEYEALRQSKLALMGSPTGRETRTLVVGKGGGSGGVGDETICIRAKGDAIDYRFMPEPDLPPLILDEETLGCTLEEYVDKLRMELGESPEEAASRLVQEYGLTMDTAGVITGDSRAILLFEETVKYARKELILLNKHGDDDKGAVNDSNMLSTLAANWLCNDLFALVKTSTMEEGNRQSAASSLEYSNVDGQRLGALIAMVAHGSLTSSMAKKVLNMMFLEGRKEHPRDIATENGWQVISDKETLLQLCNSVVFDPKNSSQLEQYTTGEERKKWKIEKYFAGKIMAASRGNAHPELMKETLGEVLKKACSVN